MLFQLIFISVVIIAIALLGIAIKMFVIKGGEFKKQCSSVDPHTGQRMSCSCASEDKTQCENETFAEVNK